VPPRHYSLHDFCIPSLCVSANNLVGSLVGFLGRPDEKGEKGDEEACFQPPQEALAVGVSRPEFL
jgi:hypothetical protein